MIKAAFIGLLISAVTAALLMCAFALILNFLSGVPYGIIDYAVVAIEGLSVLTGAYFAAVILKSRGIIIGFITALAFLIISVAVAMGAGKADISALTLIRAAVLFICGIGGGILGVNKKEKIRIH